MATVCNPCLNVLATYCASMEVQFATSKMGLDSWYNKLCIRVASRVAERLKDVGSYKIR